MTWVAILCAKGLFVRRGGCVLSLDFPTSKALPFFRDGLFDKASPFSLPCFTAGFVFLYLFVSKGSVACLVVNQLHWLWTRWTGKSRKQKGGCIYVTAVSWQWSQLQLQALLRSTAPIQEQCAWNLLPCSRWQQFTMFPSTIAQCGCAYSSRLKHYVTCLSLRACSVGDGAVGPVASLLLSIRPSLVAVLERSLSVCVSGIGHSRKLLATVYSINPALTVNHFLSGMSMKLEGNLPWRWLLTFLTCSRR